MKSSLVTTQVLTPYAQALMSIARSNDLVDRFGDDISFLLDLLNQSEDLRTLLASPLIKADVKKGVLRQIVGEQLHSFMFNFLMLLVDRGRVSFLQGVCEQYQALLRELRQTVLAEVTSAVELTDAQKDSVRQRVRDMVSAQQVELETHVNSELIGGVIIKVGSQVIDASLRGQLRRLGLLLSSSL
jgi:F-type H+-transporting ATPase subunit delta